MGGTIGRSGELPKTEARIPKIEAGGDFRISGFLLSRSPDLQISRFAVVPYM
jgi:hypothetical protein